MITKIITDCCGIDNGLFCFSVEEYSYDIDKNGLIINTNNRFAKGLPVLAIFKTEHLDNIYGACMDDEYEAQITIYFSDGTVFNNSEIKQAFLKLVKELKEGK